MLINKSRTIPRRIALHTMPQYSTSKFIRPDWSDETGTLTGYNHRGPPFLSGGPVIIQKRTFSHIISDMQQGFDPGFGFSYRGRFCCVPHIPASALSPFTDLTALGTSGWKRAVEDIQVFNVAQAIGELRDLPKTIRGLWEQASYLWFLLRQWKAGRLNLGGAYLNWVFGVFPFLSDLEGFMNLANNAAKRYAKISEREGPKRKKFDLLNSSFEDPVTFQSNGSMGSLWPGVFAAMYKSGTNSSTETTKRYKRRVWFSCKYEWVLPTFKYKSKFNRFVNFGIQSGLSPAGLAEAAYNLIPWTWLLDWFVSLGDSITNARRISSGLRCHYGYVMSSYERKVTVKTMGTLLEGTYIGVLSKYRQVTAACITTDVVKQRAVASPLGVGFFSLWSFDFSQFAILLALGTSRLGYR